MDTANATKALTNTMTTEKDRTRRESRLPVVWVCGCSCGWWMPHAGRTIKGNAPLIRTNILSSCGSVDVSLANKRKPRLATIHFDSTRFSSVQFVSLSFILIACNGSCANSKRVLVPLSQSAIYVHAPRQFCNQLLLRCVIPSVC